MTRRIPFHLLIDRLHLERRNRQSIVLFVAIICYLALVFLPQGELFDNDTESYLYLLGPYKWHWVMPNFWRPPLYPLYLYLQHFLDEVFRLHTYLLLTYAIVACTTIIYLRLLKLASLNRYLQIIGILYLLFNFQLLQFVNFVNSEILFFGFIVIHAYAMSSYLHKKDYASLLLVVLTILFMTFTKPIMLYYPYLLFFFFLLLRMKRVIRTRHLIVFSLLFVVIYCVPVYLWSAGNRQKSHMFVFSGVSEVNLLGKLMQYDMIYDLHQQQYRYVYRSLYEETNKKKDIYKVLNTAGYDLNLPMSLALHDFSSYGHSVLQTHGIEYLQKSFQLMPEIITSVPLFNLLHCPRTGRKDIYLNIHTVCSSFFLYTYAEIYTQLYFLLAQPIVIVVAVASAALRLFRLRMKRHLETSDFLYLWTILFVGYIVFIISSGSYEQYTRLRAPFDGILVFFLLLSLSNLSNTLRSFANSLRDGQKKARDENG